MDSLSCLAFSYGAHIPGIRMMSGQRYVSWLTRKVTQLGILSSPSAYGVFVQPRAPHRELDSLSHSHNICVGISEDIRCGVSFHLVSSLQLLSASVDGVSVSHLKPGFHVGTASIKLSSLTSQHDLHISTCQTDTIWARTLSVSSGLLH